MIASDTKFSPAKIASDTKSLLATLPAIQKCRQRHCQQCRQRYKNVASDVANNTNSSPATHSQRKYMIHSKNK
jgi:hypothetical protein